jgi:hypothetical protein
VLFNRPDKLEWINAIEIQSCQSSLRYVIFLQVVNMAFVPPVRIDPQFKPLREERKAVAITGGCAWAIVVGKELKASTASMTLR